MSTSALTPATVLAHGSVVPHSPFVSGPPLPTLVRLYPPGFRSRLVLPAGEAYQLHIEDLGDRPVFVVTSELAPTRCYRELELGAALRVPLERAGLPVAQDFEWLSGLTSIQSELLEQFQACLMTHLRTNDTQLRRGKRRKVKDKHEKPETRKLAQGALRAAAPRAPLPPERTEVLVDDIPLPNFDVDSEEEERPLRRRQQKTRQAQSAPTSLLPAASTSSASSSVSASLSSAGSGELGESASVRPAAASQQQQPPLKRRRVAPATLPLPPVPMRTATTAVTAQNPLVNLVLLGRFFNLARPG